MKTWELEPCPCGQCRDFHLKGVGKFVQGSGFTFNEASAIIKMRELVEAVLDSRNYGDVLEIKSKARDILELLRKGS